MDGLWGLSRLLSGFTPPFPTIHGQGQGSGCTGFGTWDLLVDQGLASSETVAFVDLQSSG